jgi:hypothetical protein
MASPADDDGVARGQELLDGAASRTAREMFLLRADPLWCSRAIGGTGTAEAGGRRRQERCFFCGIAGQVNNTGVGRSFFRLRGKNKEN